MHFSRAARICVYCSLTVFCTTSRATCTAFQQLVRKRRAGISSTNQPFWQHRGQSSTTTLGRILRSRSHLRSFSFSVLNMSTEATVDVATNLKDVKARVAAATEKVANASNVRLVAVSKTKPMELLEAAYESGCRCFGENYVQELVQKAENWKDRSDVQWHFIGALQSNKCNVLVNTCADNVSRLTVETVASVKLANKLNTAVQNLEGGNTDQRLKVFVQVNTSGEESKSGVEPGSECIKLCQYIAKECPGLELRGLMTIGAIGDLSCFSTLRQCRDEVLAQLDGVAELELSMGMSGDFEEAILAGATNVRVGSTIFGERDYSNKK